MVRDFEEFDKLSSDLISILTTNETELLQNISKHSFDDFNNDPETWRQLQMQALERREKEGLNIVLKSVGKQDKEIDRILNEVVGTTVREASGDLKVAVDNGFLRNASDLEVEGVINSLVDNARIFTEEKFSNLNAIMINDYNNQYRNVINDSFAQFITGNQSLSESVYNMNLQLERQGLTGYFDSAGREWSADAYGKMLMRSASGDLVTESTLAANALYNNDFIEISSHGEARDKCFEDQGKIYNLNGGSGYIEDLDGNKIKYYDWGNTSYGDADGILGVNCRHNMYVFIPGISSQSFRENDEYKKKTNDKDYDIRQEENRIKDKAKTSERIENLNKDVKRGIEQETKYMKGKYEAGSEELEAFNKSIARLEKKIAREQLKADEIQKVADNIPF